MIVLWISKGTDKTVRMVYTVAKVNDDGMAEWGRVTTRTIGIVSYYIKP